MQALAPTTTAVDPSIAGNVLPFRSWASAWWETWMQREALTKAFQAAKCRLASVKGSPWNMVAGPAAALAATCQRLGWDSVDGKRFTDDLGDEVDMALDPPAAVVAAMTRSATRWGFAKVLKELPAARPPTTDRAQRINAQDRPSTMLLDASSGLRPLLKGTGGKAKKRLGWTAEYRPALISAINGGQWTQSHKAKLPEWQHGDKCQLCLREKGTPEHRLHCSAIVPDEGWPAPLRRFAAFFSELSAVRFATLRNRAVLPVEFHYRRSKLSHQVGTG